MAIKLSTGLRQGLAVTGPLRTLIGGSVIRIYSGSAPADADSSIGAAVLLCEISAGGTGTGITFEASAPGGVLSKTASETWSGTNVASGTASFFRMVLPSDAGTASSTATRMQGTVAQLAADLELSNTALVSGSPLAINSANFTIPAQA